MDRSSKNKVILGLSGGVDSTAAALLLKEEGFKVTGLYLRTFRGDREGEKAAADLAERLGISFISADVSEEFEREIIRPFCEGYAKGETPNPCVLCNSKIKFKKLIEAADKAGAYYIATGHYAGVCYDEKDSLYFIRKSRDLKRDQSYMLYGLKQGVIARVIFPLGGILSKEKTRQAVRKHSLPNWEASDSMDICFINKKEGNYVSFIRSRGYCPREGEFVDKEGKVLGMHQGITRYTVGQRKGLGISLGKPAFVISLDPGNNRVVLGENSDLFKRKAYSRGNVFAADKIYEKLKAGPMAVYAKVRCPAEPVEAEITLLGSGRVMTEFASPVRAVSPGQSVVFYQEDHIIGGGIIENGQGQTE